MKKNNQNYSKTNVNEVKKQNEYSAMNQQNMGEEFASETNFNEVKAQNQRSERNKKNASSSNMNQTK